VEDGIKSFSILDKIVKSYGFMTHRDWIDSSQEYLHAKIHELLPDLILLNWVCGFDFWDVCENLNTNDQTKDIPVLNFVNPDYYKINSVPAIVITKPVDVHEFDTLLEQLA
jgi:DNA-binding response OmpR family regulator